MIDIANECNRIVLDVEYVVNGNGALYINSYQGNAYLGSTQREVPLSEISEIEAYLQTQKFTLFERRNSMNGMFIDYRRG